MNKKKNTKRRKPMGEIIEKEMKDKEAKLAKKKRVPVKRCGQCRSELHDKKSCPELGKQQQLPQVNFFPE